MQRELIKVENKFVEKEFAFPDLEGDQTALMVKWDGEKWIVSGWGAAIDNENKEILGWEPLMETNKQMAIEFVNELMENIQSGK